MRYQQWNTLPVDGAAVRALMASGYPYLLSGVLASRGITTPEAAADFLACDHQLRHSPWLLADMDRAVARIEAAIAAGERIAVFGDYDVDGITATVILVDYLRSRGADVLYYIPRRLEDGYGLSREAIDTLRDRGVELIVTVDCGITGVEEVTYAASLGIEAVVTDHHECKEVLPGAVAVVDPHRPDCPYPFKHLAGCGVALMLVLALGGPDREEALLSRYCTLAAIGTVADVMQMSGENRTIVRRGLEAIDHSDFLGLHALLQEAGLAGRPITAVQIGYVLSPRINAAGRMGAAELAAELLLCDDEARSAALAAELCALNRQRQSVEQEIYAQAAEMIEALPPQERSALVLSSDQWHQGVVGIVASRLSERYGCPSFMIHLGGGVGKGSCRSWGGFNLFGALESCSDLLLGFGGHELAAGFTIREENIPAFRERINRCVAAAMGPAAPVSALTVDMDIDRPGAVTLEEVEALESLEPCGAGNTRPIFCLRCATLERAQNVGQNRHLKVRLTHGSASLEGIFFSATAEGCGCAVGSRVDAAFYLQINEFRGSRTVQLQLVDMRPSLCPSGREEELLTLVGRAVAGETLSARESMRLLPSREQFVQLWRALQRTVPEEGLETDRLPFLRRLAADIGGSEPFLRTALALAVFRERGLLESGGDQIRLHLRRTDRGKKVDLDSSPYLRRLRQIPEEEHRGGGAT